MKYLAALLATLATITLANAQDPPAAEIDESVIDSLFGDHATIASFTDAIEFAEQAGVDPQLLIEAETNYYLFKNSDMASIRKLVKKLEKQAQSFDTKKSRLFKSKDGFTAMAEYAKAIIAYSSGDEAGLKKHITEAIWLDPANAPSFASLIRSYRLQQRSSE